MRSYLAPLTTTAALAVLATVFTLTKVSAEQQGLAPLIRGHLDKGLAEFNVYDASLPRYGEMRNAVITHIWVKEPWDASRGIKWGGTDSGDLEVLKLNQIASYPTGLYRYEQMWSGFWNTETASLVKFSMTHHEACGNTYKQGRTANGLLDYVAFSYFEGEGESAKQTPWSENAFFYDELPLRLRMLAFNQPLKNPLRISLFPSVIHTKIDQLSPQSATITQSSDSSGAILFTVDHPNGSDRFTFASESPHLLISWKRADGGSLTLRKSLLIDYWNKNHRGDESLLVP